MEVSTGDRLNGQIRWLSSYGMCFGDPVKQAEHDLMRLGWLRDGAVASPEDIGYISRIIAECSVHIEANILLEAIAALESKHPAFKNARSVRAAA